MTVIVDDFEDSSTAANDFGVNWISTPQGTGADFDESRESRIVFPYSDSFPRQGTFEMRLKVDYGYSYSNGSGPLTSEVGATVFTTDIVGGDVTWPGSAWLWVGADGTVSLRIAKEKYGGGGGDSVVATSTTFRMDEWHTVSISYGSLGMAIGVDGLLVAQLASNTQTLAGGGTHYESLGQPTVGESVPSFWAQNQYEGGFNGVVDAIRYSDQQMDFALHDDFIQAAPVANLKSIALQMNGHWQQKSPGSSVLTAVYVGDVILGHANGRKDLLRISHATIETDGTSISFRDAVVTSANGNRDPLFSGDFTLNVATGQSSYFKEEAPTHYTTGQDYDLLDGLVEFNVGSLGVFTDRVNIGADIALPWISATSSGNQASINVTGAGPQPWFGTLSSGAFDEGHSYKWTAKLPNTRGNLHLEMTDVGVNFDVGKYQLFIMGKATASLNFFGANRAFEIDFAGTPDNNPNVVSADEKFIRVSYDGARTGFDWADWDFVGSFKYTADPTYALRDKLNYWGIREAIFALDTINNKYSAGFSAAMNVLGGIEVSGQVDWYLDPMEFEGFEAAVSAGTRGVPLWFFTVTGGKIGTTGWADRLDDDPKANTYLGLDIALGPNAQSPIKGTVTLGAITDPRRGVFAFDGMSVNLEASAKARNLMTETQYNSLLSGAFDGGPKFARKFGDWLGMSAKKIADLEIFTLDGKAELDLVKEEFSLDLDASFFGGLYTGDLKFEVDSTKNDLTFFMKVAGHFPEGIPRIGGKEYANMNLYFDYSWDGDRANDTISIWTEATFDFPLISAFKAAIGFRFAFDFSVEIIGLEDVRYISNQGRSSLADGNDTGWALKPSMEWALLTARWEQASTGAQLVLITPDGKRLSEAQIAARDDMIIVEDLSNRFSRSVAILSPDAGNWLLRVKSPTPLGEVTYDAGSGVERPDLNITAVKVNTETHKLVVSLDASGGTKDVTLRFFIDNDRLGKNGSALSDQSFDLANGENRFSIDFADAAPGRHFVYLAASRADMATVFEYASTRVDLNLLNGSAKDDLLTGSRFGELIVGGKGKDTLAPMGGADTIDGGQSFDIVSYSSAKKGVIVDLSSLQATSAGDKSGLISIEGAIGGAGADQLLGNDGANKLGGLAGADKIWGMGGADSVEGDAGSDRLFGALGDDQIWGGDGTDRLFGGQDRDMLDGGEGKDVLDGGEQADRLFGGAGRDRLLGQSGDDRLIGGAGSDVMTGGQGKDIFIFAAATEIGTARSSDQITDFVTGTDRINLSELPGQGIFIGKRAFTGEAGEVRYIRAEGLLSGDINGDGRADWVLRLDTDTRLAVADLIL